MAKNNLLDIYYQLLESYGPQGWWPLQRKINGQLQNWYHPGDYSFPHNRDEVFEICIGAILTQNTNWNNVVRALDNLFSQNKLTANAILKTPAEEIAQLIRPAGYYNQKSRYLKNFAIFFSQLADNIPTRKQLLSITGIGKETADSMLLYAWKQPHFVVDAYTRRIFGDMGFFSPKAKYDDIKQTFESALPRDLIIYQEYHALIVRHAKQLRQKSAGKKG